MLLFLNILIINCCVRDSGLKADVMKAKLSVLFSSKSRYIGCMLRETEAMAKAYLRNDRYNTQLIKTLEKVVVVALLVW